VKEDLKVDVQVMVNHPVAVDVKIRGVMFVVLTAPLNELIREFL